MLPDLDLRGALADVRRTGAAFVPEALAETCRERLHREVSGVALAGARGTYGKHGVRQEADVAVTADFGRFPQLTLLRDELVARVHRDGAGIEGTTAWWPDELSVQRYRPADAGITAHLDHRRYAVLVAVFTTTGEADFTLCRNRAGDAVAMWRAGPASLVLLRAPGFDGLDDGRPLHAVTGPTGGDRVSVSLRMDTPSPGR
ncbi:MAG: hypothetical protein GEV09_11595 [Pseudonocardiaceae bacterium]|nr:hypothetical protein [Pseudonocardiaceae bacterium]